MKPELIFDALHTDPFQPMRFRLRDGRVFDIPLRQMVVVGKTYVDIGIQAADETAGICQTIVHCCPEDVIQVEPISLNKPTLA